MSNFEDLTDFQGSTRSPFMLGPPTFRVPQSELFSQVKCFLPILQNANEELSSNPTFSAEPDLKVCQDSDEDEQEQQSAVFLDLQDDETHPDDSDDGSEDSDDCLPDVSMEIISLGILPDELPSSNPVFNMLLTDSQDSSLPSSNPRIMNYPFTPESGSIAPATASEGESSFFSQQTTPINMPLIVCKDLFDRSI